MVLFILWYYLFYGIMVLWYYGIMVLYNYSVLFKNCNNVSRSGFASYSII